MKVEGQLKVVKENDGYYYFDPILDEWSTDSVTDMDELNEKFFKSSYYIQLSSSTEKDFKQNKDGSYSVPVHFEFQLHTMYPFKSYLILIGNRESTGISGSYTEIKNFVKKSMKANMPALKEINNDFINNIAYPDKSKWYKILG